MKKLSGLSILFICLLLACNTSKEEIRPMEENKENSINMQDIKIEKEIFYSIQSCGKVYQSVLTENISAVRQTLSSEAEEGDKFCALRFIIQQGTDNPVNIAIVKLLLDAKTNVNAKMILETDYGDNYLIEKATAANSSTLVKLLLEAGANTESKNRALNVAAEKNYIQIVKLLLAADIEDFAKNKALSTAINWKHFEIAEMLLSSGAKIKGDSLAAIVASGNTALVKAVLNAGAPKNDKRKALINAINTSNAEIVKLLLEADTDINGYKKNNTNSSNGEIRIYDIWEDSALEIALYRQEQILSSKKQLQEEIEMESDPNCFGCGPDEEEFSRLERIKKEEKNITEIINILKAAGAKK